MKKILVAMLLITMAICFSACTEKTEKYTDEDGNVKEFTYVIRETSDKFALFEEGLAEKDITFEVEMKADGIIDGAIEGRKYILETGKTFEIYKFDIKSEAYRETAKTSKLYVEMFDAYINAAVNDEYAMFPANDEGITDLFLSFE